MLWLGVFVFVVFHDSKAPQHLVLSFLFRLKREMEFEDTDIYQAILDNDRDTLAQLLASSQGADLLAIRGLDGQSYLHLAVDVDANR